MLAGTIIILTGCESDSPTPGLVVSISVNHGHIAQITSAQLTLAMLTLNIQGAATHPHTIELGMSDLQGLADGNRVSVTSTTDDGHSHIVTFK